MQIIKNTKLILLILLLTSYSSCSETYGNVPDNGEKSKVPAGDVTLFVTTNNRSQDFKKQTVSFNTKRNISSTTIKLEPACRFQTMDGFGAAVTGSSAFNLMKMTK